MVNNDGTLVTALDINSHSCFVTVQDTSGVATVTTLDLVVRFYRVGRLRMEIGNLWKEISEGDKFNGYILTESLLVNSQRQIFYFSSHMFPSII